MRWLLLVLACLAAITMFLLATASANTALFARRYDLLLVLNGALVVLLMLLVGYQLWRLSRNLKAGVFGSRLAVRLVLLFALVAVLPGALVYAVSVQFLGKSIESWFDVRVDRALEGGLNLGPQRAGLPAQGHEQQGGPGRADARRGGARQPVGAAQSGRRAGGHFRSRRVLVDRERARRRGHRRLDRAAGDAARPGAAARAAAADSGNDRAARRRRHRPSRRHARQQRRPAGAAQGASGHRAGPEGAGRGHREGAGRRARLRGDFVLAAIVEAPLCSDPDVDAAPRAHLRARPRRGAVGALFRAAGPARRGDACGRPGRFHATAAGDLARRAGCAHRVVQHDDRPARRGAAEDRGIAPRHGDDARVSGKHPRQSFGRRARVRRSLPAAHGERERGGDPAAAARRVDRRAAVRLGGQAAGAGAVCGARRRGLPRERGRPVAETGRAVGGQPDADAAAARVAPARHPGRRLRRRVRRRDRSRAGAARRRVGRGRPPSRARDQESADADPALGGAARAKALGEARRAGPGGARRAARRRSSRRWRR